MNAIEEFLREAVYYPCSGTDGAPVKFTGKRFTKFLYADYAVTKERLLHECQHQGFRGYQASDVADIDVQSVFGGDWSDIAHQHQDILQRLLTPWIPETAYLIAVKFTRLDTFPEEHGPPSLALWFARCEAIATFRSVFTRRGIAPKCLAYIRSGIGFGGNFTQFPRALERTVAGNPAGLPQYMLSDHIGRNPRWGDYCQLVEAYHALERWDYRTEHYGHSNLTLGKRIRGHEPMFRNRFYGDADF